MFDNDVAADFNKYLAENFEIWLFSIVLRCSAGIFGLAAEGLATNVNMLALSKIFFEELTMRSNGPSSR